MNTTGRAVLMDCYLSDYTLVSILQIGLGFTAAPEDTTLVFAERTPA